MDRVRLGIAGIGNIAALNAAGRPEFGKHPSMSMTTSVGAAAS
ncbi:MAG: hypothetical protein ACYDAQ_21310 [Mycobacteriales bacterium]